MGRFISQLLTVGAVLGALATPQAALGTESLVPPVTGAVLTRYGVRYQTAAGDTTHRGLDLGASEGSVVIAAVDGVVTFAGLVPADGGGRTTAVTITTPSGLLVTVSPLAAARVGKGENVVAGDDLGTLAGTGDASSAQPHVHLSVRISGTYVDPEPLLWARAAEPQPQPEPITAPQPQPQPQPQPVPQPAQAQAPAPSAQSHAGAAALRVTHAADAAIGSPAGSSFAARARASAGAAPSDGGAMPAGLTLSALQRAQAGLRSGAGATAGAARVPQASHVAPEMLRTHATLNAPHLSGTRTAGVGALLAAAAGLALWSVLDRREGAPARSGTQ